MIDMPLPTPRTCPAPGCGRPIRSDHYACTQDWKRLPADIRLDISRTFGRRRTLAARMASPEDMKAAQAMHEAAMARAATWYAGNPR